MGQKRVWRCPRRVGEKEERGQPAREVTLGTERGRRRGNRAWGLPRSREHEGEVTNDFLKEAQLCLQKQVLRTLGMVSEAPQQDHPIL